MIPGLVHFASRLVWSWRPREPMGSTRGALPTDNLLDPIGDAGRDDINDVFATLSE